MWASGGCEEATRTQELLLGEWQVVRQAAPTKAYQALARALASCCCTLDVMPLDDSKGEMLSLDDSRVETQLEESGVMLVEPRCTDSSGLGALGLWMLSLLLLSIFCGADRLAI